MPSRRNEVRACRRARPSAARGGCSPPRRDRSWPSEAASWGGSRPSRLSPCIRATHPPPTTRGRVAQKRARLARGLSQKRHETVPKLCATALCRSTARSASPPSAQPPLRSTPLRRSPALHRVGRPSYPTERRATPPGARPRRPASMQTGATHPSLVTARLEGSLANVGEANLVVARSLLPPAKTPTASPSLTAAEVTCCETTSTGGLLGQRAAAHRPLRRCRR